MLSSSLFSLLSASYVSFDPAHLGTSEVGWCGANPVVMKSHPTSLQDSVAFGVKVVLQGRVVIRQEVSLLRRLRPSPSLPVPIFSLGFFAHSPSDADRFLPSLCLFSLFPVCDLSFASPRALCILSVSLTVHFFCFTVFPFLFLSLFLPFSFQVSLFFVLSLLPHVIQ